MAPDNRDQEAEVRIRAARGAITVASDDRTEVLGATERLLREVLARNQIEDEAVVSIIFTATDDLHSAFPAEAARRMGLTSVALLCAQDLAVEGGLASCVRVLVHFHSTRPAGDVEHVYLEGAGELSDGLH